MAGWPIKPGENWSARDDLAFVGRFVDGDLAMSERRTQENAWIDGVPGPGSGTWAMEQQELRFRQRGIDGAAFQALVFSVDTWLAYFWGEGEELTYVLLGKVGRNEMPVHVIPGARQVIEGWASRQNPPLRVTWSEKRFRVSAPALVCDRCGSDESTVEFSGWSPVLSEDRTRVQSLFCADCAS